VSVLLCQVLDIVARLGNSATSFQQFLPRALQASLTSCNAVATQCHSATMSQDKENLQHDLIKLNSWADNWLIKLNISKCKCKNNVKRFHLVDTENIEHSSINNVELENVESIKDLGVLFDSHLKFALHIREKINKAIVFLVL